MYSGRPETDYGTSEWPSYVKSGLVWSILASIAGSLVGAYGGWGVAQTSLTEYETWECVSGLALTGAVVGFFVAFLLSGILQWLMVKFWSSTPLPPAAEGAARTQAAGVVRTMADGPFGYQIWDMHVTIHRVQNVFNSLEHILLSGPEAQSLFVEVLVGRTVERSGQQPYFSLQQNAPMKTCINKHGVFEESFHVNVMPTDNTVRIQMFSQEILFDKFLGYCDIDINQEVIRSGFPQKLARNLMNPDLDEDFRSANEIAGTVVLSFLPGPNLKPTTTRQLAANNINAFAQMNHIQEKETHLLKQTYGAYGTWATAAGGQTAV